jgi:hypothetical protein
MASILGSIAAQYCGGYRLRVGCRPTTASGISDKRRLAIEVAFCDLELDLRLS